jgi:hypothetical protein
MIKYLARRQCPKCRHSFIIMLLTLSSQMRTINGFCGHCDHSIKWRLIQRKVFAKPNYNARKQIIARLILENENKVEVPAYD